MSGRNYGRILTSIWDIDGDFRELPSHAQHLYIALITSPHLKHCGLIEYSPEKLARLASDLSIAKVKKSVVSLEDQRYVVVDRSTTELLVRTFVRHDGVLSSPNMTAAMAKAYRLIESECIRQAVVTELRRMYREQPQLAGWSSEKVQGLKEADPDLFAEVSGKPFGEPFQEPFAESLEGRVA